MKDYSLNLEDAKTFILSYKVKEDKIIVKLASKEDYTIPCTPVNKNKILKRMKAQVINSKDYEEKVENKLLWSQRNAIISARFIALSAAMVIPAGLVSMFLCASFAIRAIYYTSKMCIYKSKKKDIEKNKLFIQNEEKLYEHCKSKKLNPNILSNTTTKTQKIVKSTPASDFTLNMIDQMSYEDLKQLLENIKLAEQFGFDYSSHHTSENDTAYIYCKRK